MNELKEEVKRMQALCDKYQRELMSSRAELRQRQVAGGSSKEEVSSSISSAGKIKTKKAEEMYSLAVVLLAAIVAFLFGVLFF